MSAVTQPIHIALPNSHIVKVDQMGSVHLTYDITLVNVLYVPDFNCNLSSIRKLTHDYGITVQFSQHHCVFQDQHQEKVLETGAEQGGLYFLTQASHKNTFPVDNKADSAAILEYVNMCCHNTVSVSTSCSKLWHLRLGHAPDTVLTHIPGVSVLSSCNKDCPICPLSKQTMLSFSHSISHYDTLFSLVHMDV